MSLLNDGNRLQEVTEVNSKIIDDKNNCHINANKPYDLLNNQITGNTTFNNKEENVQIINTIKNIELEEKENKLILMNNINPLNKNTHNIQLNTSGNIGKNTKFLLDSNNKINDNNSNNSEQLSIDEYYSKSINDNKDDKDNNNTVVIENSRHTENDNNDIIITNNTNLKTYKSSLSSKSNNQSQNSIDYINNKLNIHSNNITNTNSEFIGNINSLNKNNNIEISNINDISDKNNSKDHSNRIIGHINNNYNNDNINTTTTADQLFSSLQSKKRLVYFNNNNLSNSISMIKKLNIQNINANSNNSNNNNFEPKEGKPFNSLSKQQKDNIINDLHLNKLRSYKQSNTCYIFDYYNKLEYTSNPNYEIKKLSDKNKHNKRFNSLNQDQNLLNTNIHKRSSSYVISKLNEKLNLNKDLTYYDNCYKPKKHLKLNDFELRRLLVQKFDKFNKINNHSKDVCFPKVCVTNKKVFDYSKSKYDNLHRIVEFPSQSKLFNRFNGYDSYLSYKSKFD